MPTFLTHPGPPGPAALSQPPLCPYLQLLSAPNCSGHTRHVSLLGTFHTCSHLLQAFAFSGLSILIILIGLTLATLMSSGDLCCLPWMKGRGPSKHLLALFICSTSVHRTHPHPPERTFSHQSDYGPSCSFRSALRVIHIVLSQMLSAPPGA